jgi:hypothetical protein
MTHVTMLLDSINRNITDMSTTKQSTYYYTWTLSPVQGSISTYAGKVTLKSPIENATSLMLKQCKLPMNSHASTDLNDIKVDILSFGKEGFFSTYTADTLVGYHFSCTAVIERNYLKLTPKGKGIIYFNPPLTNLTTLSLRFFSGSMPYELIRDFDTYILVSGNPTILKLQDTSTTIPITSGELIFIVTPILSINSTVNNAINSTYGYNVIKVTDTTLSIPLDTSEIFWTQKVVVYYASRRLLLEFDFELE